MQNVLSIPHLTADEDALIERALRILESRAQRESTLDSPNAVRDYLRIKAAQDLASLWNTEEIRIPTISLDDLLEKLGIERIDFLNMDIELWEPYALAGFNIDKYKPELVCIEAHHQVRDQLLPYFLDHGYVRLDQYFLFDHRNWYFTPKDIYAEMFDVAF